MLNTKSKTKKNTNTNTKTKKNTNTKTKSKSKSNTNTNRNRNMLVGGRSATKSFSKRAGTLGSKTRSNDYISKHTLRHEKKQAAADAKFVATSKKLEYKLSRAWKPGAMTSATLKLLKQRSQAFKNRTKAETGITKYAIKSELQSQLQDKTLSPTAKASLKRIADYSLQKAISNGKQRYKTFEFKRKAMRPNSSASNPTKKMRKLFKSAGKASQLSALASLGIAKHNKRIETENVQRQTKMREFQALRKELLNTGATNPGQQGFRPRPPEPEQSYRPRPDAYQQQDFQQDFQQGYRPRPEDTDQGYRPRPESQPVQQGYQPKQEDSQAALKIIDFQARQLQALQAELARRSAGTQPAAPAQLLTASPEKPVTPEKYTNLIKSSKFLNTSYKQNLTTLSKQFPNISANSARQVIISNAKAFGTSQPKPKPVSNSTAAPQRVLNLQPVPEERRRALVRKVAPAAPAAPVVAPVAPVVAPVVAPATPTSQNKKYEAVEARTQAPAAPVVARKQAPVLNQSLVNKNRAALAKRQQERLKAEANLRERAERAQKAAVVSSSLPVTTQPSVLSLLVN